MSPSATTRVEWARRLTQALVAGGYVREADVTPLFDESRAGGPSFTALVIGREIFMTVFRQAAARRGVVISAIGPAKWKTGFQSVWVGSAYFWFFAATLAARQEWQSAAWRTFAYFNGIVGTVTMVTSVVLTVYSLALYLRQYAGVFTR